MEASPNAWMRHHEFHYSINDPRCLVFGHWTYRVCRFKVFYSESGISFKHVPWFFYGSLLHLGRLLIYDPAINLGFNMISIRKGESALPTPLVDKCMACLFYSPWKPLHVVWAAWPRAYLWRRNSHRQRQTRCSNLQWWRRILGINENSIWTRTVLLPIPLSTSLLSANCFSMVTSRRETSCLWLRWFLPITRHARLATLGI